MSYRIKVPPKTLPVDEAHLLSGIDRLALFLQQHRLPAVVGLAVCVLAVVIVGTVIWYDQYQAGKAAELYHQASVLYIDRPTEPAGKADENLKRAIPLYKQVVEEYPRTPSAELALFQLGNALVQINDFAGAVDAYQRYAVSYGTNKMLLGMVYQRLGYAYLLKGDPEQAGKAFAMALEVPGALNKDQALFEMGKLEESQSRPEGALARYQDLMKTYPNSPFAGEATVRIKALEAKSPATGGMGMPGIKTGPQ